MPSTFINPVVNPDKALGVAAFDETAPVRRWEISSSDEITAVIRAIYKQVLGNAYVMESERQHIPESQFRQGDLNVREFIRLIAKSELYCTRFFESGSRNRFIELNFKHFLGRAPESRAEIAAHSAILERDGYDAEIDAYLDSDEYQQSFGTDTVPYYRGYKTGVGTKLVGFTHLFPLLRGASSSDKSITANNPARLSKHLFTDQASPVISPSGATSRRGSGEPLKTGNWLGDLFKQKPPATPEQSEQPASPFANMDDSELATQSRAQSSQIEQLQKQLDELRSLSSMGAAILRKGQRLSAAEVDPYAASSTAASGGSGLTQQVSEQAKTIEQLRGELMSARSLATIAESRLNKWRSRSY
ncbi:MAG: phycobilisome rod-core linker polypeptide [Phormidesmis sp.]